MAIEIFDGIVGPQSYDTVYYEPIDQSFLCFLNRRFFYVHDLTPSFQLVQSTPLSSFDPTTIPSTSSNSINDSWVVLSVHPWNANVAIVVQNQVIVLHPAISPSQRVQWVLENVFSHGSTIHSITWLNSDLLFSSNHSLYLTSVTGTKLWCMDIARSMFTLIPSPHHQAFAGFGLHDRLVRVWIPEKENKFQFKYLPHPKAVINAVWKKHTEDLRILTSSRDTLARLWVWSSLANEFQLYLTFEAPLPHASISFHFFNKHALMDPPSKRVLLHNASTPSSSSSYSSSKSFSVHTLASMKQSEPELNTLLEHLDELVFAIQSNGSICIWGISNLDRRLGETSASIIKVIPNRLSHSNLDTFVHLHLIHQTHVSKKDHLFWIGYSKTSTSLTCFSVHLASLLFQPHSTISILKIWGGHTTEGTKAFYLLDSSTLISQSGNETVIWKFQQSKHDVTQSTEPPSLLTNGKEKLYSSSYIPLSEFDRITSCTSGITFFNRHMHSESHLLSIPFIVSYLSTHSIQSNNSSPPSSLSSNVTELIPFSAFSSASIRMVPSISESTLMLSLIGSTTLATYELPHFHLHYSYTSSVPIHTACFAFYPTTYDAVVVDTQGTVSLLGLNGALLSSSSIVSLISSKTHMDSSPILQCSLSGDTLALRSATQVWIFGIRVFTHELYLQSILEVATSYISLASPKPGLNLLASSSDHVLDVYATTLTFSSSSSSPSSSNSFHFSSTLSSMDVTWSSIFKHTFDSTIELFQWTSTFELMLFVNHRIQFLGLFPSLVSLALSKTSYPFYHPTALREWLMWNGMDQVEAIFNHLYFCLKSNLLSSSFVPLIPFSSLFPDAASSSSSSSSNHGTADFEAFLNATEASLSTTAENVSSDFHFSMEELSLFSKEKATVLKEHWQTTPSPDSSLHAEFIAILDLIFELKQLTLDDMGQRYFAEVLFYFHLGKQLPESQVPFISLDAFLFAFFSHSQSTLADFLHRSFTLTWPIAKALGIGYWLTDLACLTTTIELVARNQWKLASNPLDCFYFYLILPGKRKLMLNLWKQAHGHAEQHVLTQFLSQEVTDKWKKTALKNAFVLLGKQRFELAACFFVLAEAYSDAVTVCLKNLNDPQLAFITCRLLNVPITLIAKYFETALPTTTTTFSSKHNHPGAVFLCDWILGKRKFCSLDLVQSPAMYQLFLAHPPPTSFQREKSNNVHFQETSSSTKLNTSHVLCQESRRALCQILTYYRDRQGGAFCKYLLRKFNCIEKPSSFHNATNLEETKRQDDQIQQVDDAFAALFGETEKKPSLDEETEDLPLFGNTLFTSSKDTPTATSSTPIEPLLTSLECDQLSKLASQLILWDASQSQLEVVTSEHAQDAYFKDYWSLLLQDGMDLKLAARLCEWTFSPIQGHLSLPINLTVYSKAYAHVLESLQDFSSFSNSKSYLVSFVMNTIKSLAHLNLFYDLSFTSPFFAILLLSFIFLLFHFQHSGNYYALATLIKHFPTFFIPPYSTNKLHVFYQELVLHLSSSSTSSSHLILDYLTAKMVLTRLESLIIESSVDSPCLVPFLIHTSLPLLQKLLQRLYHEIQVQQTHICSPSEDWLSAAQQELHSVLTYNPAWLQSLRKSSSLLSPTFTSSINSPPKASSSTSSPSSLLSSESTSNKLSTSTITTAAAHSSSSIDSHYVSIDTLFKNDYPILSMALHARGHILGVALHKHVIEFHLDMAHRAKTSSTHSESHSLHGTPSVSENVPVSSESTPLTSNSKPSGEFNLLKKVHLPRSNSEHLNLANIVTEPGFLMERPGFPVSIASHPLLNLYAVGQFVDNKSSLSLYSYQVKEDQMPIAHYGSAKIMKLLFDSSGSRLGIADGNGELGFFDIEAWRLFYTLPCHVRYTSDLIFYKHDSLIATAGSSPGHINNVALWDTLMPMNYAKVRGYNIHESGASAIASDGNYLVSGGKKGDLYVLDIRSSKPLFTVQSSHSCVSALALHHHRVYSGTTDGSLRVYDISTSNLTELTCYKQLHQSKKLIATSLNQMPVSTLGITQILAGDHYLLTCGADGFVKWLH